MDFTKLKVQRGRLLLDQGNKQGFERMKKRVTENTKIASKGRVLSPQGACIVFPCIGSQTQVTICPALRTALIKCGSLTLMFSAPILAIIVILPGLLTGFRFR